MENKRATSGLRLHRKFANRIQRYCSSFYIYDEFFSKIKTRILQSYLSIYIYNYCVTCSFERGKFIKSSYRHSISKPDPIQSNLISVLLLFVVTTKYWIRKEDFPEVLLKSASELPILVYGKSGLLTKNPKDPSEGKKQFWKSLASPISSVYFDSENMDLYKERIKRSEGAQLFRVRWYGNKPKSDDVIFLELKTHHECWIDNKSVKERVGIVEKHMLTLMDTSSGPWAPEYAKKLVLEANPDASEEESGVSTALLLVIRDLFCKLKLRACVRTSYSRAAFQSAKNNNLRLTIDRDITVIDETKVQNEGSWCIEDNDIVPIDAFVKVPYGVFEVKVSDGKHPLFIEELQASDAIVEAPKFSKFLTGASLHNADKVVSFKDIIW